MVRAPVTAVSLGSFPLFGFLPFLHASEFFEFAQNNPERYAYLEANLYLSIDPTRVHLPFCAEIEIGDRTSYGTLYRDSSPVSPVALLAIVGRLKLPNLHFWTETENDFRLQRREAEIYVIGPPFCIHKG